MQQRKSNLLVTYSWYIMPSTLKGKVTQVLDTEQNPRWKDKAPKKALTSLPMERKTLWAENDQSDRQNRREIRDPGVLIGRVWPTGFFVPQGGTLVVPIDATSVVLVVPVCWSPIWERIADAKPTHGRS